MVPVVPAVLCCSFFLCGLGEALLARCVGGLCAFQRPGDFQGSRTACMDQGGQLLLGDTGGLLELVAGLGDRFWLQAERGERSADMCRSVSAEAKLEWTLCRSQLAGFLCQYPPGSFCAPLNTTRNSQVSYISYTDLEVVGSDTFPPGAMAVARRLGAEHPESKHVCVSAGWLEAPWSCEVLRGGCDHGCSSPGGCVCSPGHLLLSNGFTCAEDPCAKCAQTCRRDADGYACSCNEGYKLAPDGESCEDLDECKLGGACTGEGEECVNTEGGVECTCMEGFDLEDGACVNVSICFQCEHQNCSRIDGVFQCVCRKGFLVSPRDPTKCEEHCTEQDCPAWCDPNPSGEGTEQCYCPKGYVVSETNSTVMCTDINECEWQECDQKCENQFGSYRCDCYEGFQLYGQSQCVPVGKEEGEDGSGGEAFTPASGTPASLQPAALPSYVQTGSVLGITVFLAMCTVLLFFLTKHAAKRCGRFELSSFKHPDVDIYYLQQVSTETYKRLSFDRQIRHEPQRL